jgi:2,4-dienoyl-CoA reductase-like NADH-dependent reductase (Old Yellow Enzyme family)
MSYRRMASLKGAAEFADYAARSGVDLKIDSEVIAGPAGPLCEPFLLGDLRIGNRFCILPMEGWDGTETGGPTELTFRRWRNFGESGAKLIWGCEAVAVQHDGRANPNQLLSSEATQNSFRELRNHLVSAHARLYGTGDDLLVGLQLTHSGRFAKPNSKTKLEPRILYHHPLLDPRCGIPADSACLSDGEIAGIVQSFVEAARRARDAGFGFVDIKHCHGYLGHEFLSAKTRPGRYGGSFSNRVRFLREVVAGIRRDAPGLLIGVRLSAFDLIPFRKGPDGVGEPEEFTGDYTFGFGLNDPSETYQLMDELETLGIPLVSITGGSPYYSPHAQRPALFPPSDGYGPPEDPLVGVARLLGAAGGVKARKPKLAVVGTGYSYLQEHLPHVAQHYVRTKQVDFVGLGRLALSYPEFPRDVLEGRPLQTKRLCRTFSDCTTGPRNGLISGCFPLDPFYREHPAHHQLKLAKGTRA